MQKFLLLLITIVLNTNSFCQSQYSEVKFVDGKDYKSAETQVLKATDYLFSTRFDEDDLERLYATEFVMKWMAGTPDFTFDLNEKLTKAFATEPELMNLYMAAMAKLALEQPTKAKDANYIGVNAVKRVLEYINKPGNNVKGSSELKKMSAALKKGELEKYLGI